MQNCCSYSYVEAIRIIIYKSLFLLHQQTSIYQFFYLPTDAQLNCLKNNFKIDIKTAPTCFGVITIIRGRII
jgi:hypothetical protein